MTKKLTITKKCAKVSAQCINTCVAIGSICRKDPDGSTQQLLNDCLTALKELNCKEEYEETKETVETWKAVVRSDKQYTEEVIKKRRAQGGNNTERDVAIWACARTTNRTQKEIGEKFDLTSSRVSKILSNMHQLGEAHCSRF